MAASGMARIAACAVAAASLAACASVPSPQGVTQTQGPYATQKIGAPYQVGGIWYVPREQPDYDQVGTASWYGDQFHLKSTANGEIFDMNAVSGAHTTLPLPCIVEVTNLDNGRKLHVRVNDRGPFVGGRIIDLSREAARELGYERAGLARVRVRYLSPAPLLGPEAGVREARLRPPARPAAAGPAWSEPAAPTEQASATLRWRGQQAWPYAAPTTPVVMTAPPAQRPSAAPVTVESLPPLAAPAAAEPPAGDIPLTEADPPSAYRIQAGAFSDEARARSVAAQLSVVGEAAVEPVQRGGETLYRVVLPAPSDQLQAYNLRHRVAEIGFADARVIPSNPSF